MTKKRLLSRAALEQSVELVRESGDWLPYLKSASGGLAKVLLLLKLADDNAHEWITLVERLANISKDLANRSSQGEDVERRVQQLKLCMEKVTAKVLDLNDRSKLSAVIMAPRDAETIASCSREIDSLLQDVQFTTSLAQSSHLNRVSEALDLQHAQVSGKLTQLHQTMSAVELKVDAAITLAHYPSTSYTSSRRVLAHIKILDREFTMLRCNDTGRCVIEADASLVLFA